jgi:hypothetical protein
MRDKKKTKNIKVRDLQPKKDAKGGRQILNRQTNQHQSHNQSVNQGVNQGVNQSQSQG